MTDLQALFADQLAEKVLLLDVGVCHPTADEARAALAELQTRANQRDDAIRRAEGSDRFNVEATQTIRALTKRVEAAEKERDEAKNACDARIRDWQDYYWKREAALQARLAETQEAIASALTSLATGPGKDGYAYSVLDAALTTHPTDEA